MKFGSFLAPSRQFASVTPSARAHLAAHEPRRNRQRRHAVRLQLLGHGIREPADVDLHEIEEQRLTVSEGIAVADFDDQAAALRDHQGRRVMARDDVRVDALAERAEAFVERHVPERFPVLELGLEISSPASRRPLVTSTRSKSPYSSGTRGPRACDPGLRAVTISRSSMVSCGLVRAVRRRVTHGYAPGSTPCARLSDLRAMPRPAPRVRRRPQHASNEWGRVWASMRAGK